MAVCFLRPCLRRGYGLIFPAPSRKSSRRKQRRSSPNIPRNQRIAGGKHGSQEQTKPKEPSQIRRFLIFRGSAFPNDGRRHQGRPFEDGDIRRPICTGIDAYKESLMAAVCPHGADRCLIHPD